jgi:putative tryptophan/tyrosine transport system substrate-binding protein
MRSRRQFVIAAALGALSIPYVRAQARTPRVGILSGLPLEKSGAAPMLLNALAQLGYRDGAGMVLDYRYTDKPDHFPALARDLIAAKCDVMFALVSEFTSRAFRDARSPIPVVFLAFDYDPVEKGIVQSLRRPGVNMTGVYVPNDALIAKRLEIAQEVLPGANRFLVLADVNTRDQLAALRTAAVARRVQLTVVEYAQPPYDFAAGLETGRREKADALMLFFSPEFTGNRAKLSALFTSYRLPVIASGIMAEAPGVLLGYGPNQANLYRLAADIGVQILKGAKAAEIPVQQPAEFDLVVNLKTAKALGVKIPYSVLARATKVIE